MHVTLESFLVDSRTNSDDSETALRATSEQIGLIYSLGTEVLLKKAQKGLLNPPLFVFTGKNKIPTAVLKAIHEEEAIAIIRLSVLETLKNNGCINIPTVYKTAQGNYIAKIENDSFYLMEFLPTDPSPISFENFLIATGNFHRYAKPNVTLRKFSRGKLEEYKEKAHFFLDTWFQEYSSTFQDDSWRKIVSLSRYFLTDEYANVYQSLPKQLIHGDNNQTNIIVSDKVPMFIDFDSLCVDVRVMDLTSYFRYGGFEQYISLLKEGRLIDFVNETYGKEAGMLIPEEEKQLNKLTLFSHIKFLSWALSRLKKYYELNNNEKMEEFHSYIQLYKEQITRILEISINASYELSDQD